jgi:hypothetical protein
MNPAEFLREQAEVAGPDVLRAMVKTFADALMSAEADAICGAPYGQRSDERTNQRNGYRAREWDTRAGTEAVALSGFGLSGACVLHRLKEAVSLCWWSGRESG